MLRNQTTHWLTWGADISKAGNRTSAGGTVTSATGKKAIAEGLDSAIADFKTEASAKPKPKPNRQTNNKDKNKGDVVGKQLQKDIKAFLIQIETYKNLYIFLLSNMNLI